MNPSATGWIDKFIDRFGNEQLIDPYANLDVFFKRAREVGFVYGVSIHGITTDSLSELQLTENEYTKVNLLHSLLFVYSQHYTITDSFESAIEAIISFYKSIERGQTSFFQKLLIDTSPHKCLEKILSVRIQKNDSTLKQDFEHIISLALLFTDVLAFNNYLLHPSNVKEYIVSFEEVLIENSFQALQSKKIKNKYDLLLLDLFKESSNNHIDLSKPSLSKLENLDLQIEKKYVLDLCCLAVNDDHKIEQNELDFLNELGENLQFSNKEVRESIESIENFISKHKSKITLFKYKHPVMHFYNQSTNTVKHLIVRNKKRLQKELTESGELMVLLGQSTIRDLDSEEKDKVKSQLLDIFKTIPSLTIFLLPGGMLLLPLFIKFIPKLLPSSFDENRIDKSKKEQK